MFYRQNYSGKGKENNAKHMLEGLFQVLNQGNLQVRQSQPPVQGTDLT